MKYLCHGIVLLVVDEALDGGEAVGIVGAAKLPTLPVMGGTFVVGTVTVGLTPRFPVSKDPSGTPARALAAGGVGDVDVGVDDAAMLPEPEPHIPDNPDVSGIPEDVDSPDVAEIAVEVDTPDDADVPEVAAVPGIALVVGAAPPPSKVAGFPNVPNGDVPMVEHGAAPLLVLGMVTVPVMPFGTGLIAGDAPGAKPLGPTDAPGVPSEEVAPIGGMAVVPTWANAGLQHNSGQAAVMINNGLIVGLRDNRRIARRASAGSAVGKAAEVMTSFSWSLTEDGSSE